jgi:DNA ligase-associated metallophosphoesterase
VIQAARSSVPCTEGPPDGALRVAGADCVADVLGGLYWPAERLLAVADLHLEKGSAFAKRGSLLPPYDTADTLARLGTLIARYAPRTVVALGDNFHDGGGAGRLATSDRATLTGLQQGREWIWITGNHDPDPAEGIGGVFMESLAAGPLTFRHAAAPDSGAGEISGHLHPVAIVGVRGRGLRRRCFASDGVRMVMPAFGAYAGGLNVRHRAFAAVFAGTFTAHVMGEARIYAITSSMCLPG